MSSDRPARAGRPTTRPADREDAPRPVRRTEPRPGPDARTYLLSGLTLFVSMTAAMVVAVAVLLVGARMYVGWQIDEMKADSQRSSQDYQQRLDQMRKDREAKRAGQ